MKCEFCAEDKPDVEVRSDPLAWEIGDTDWQVPICLGCMQERADAV
ncbi:hypothetical protein [Streptomyces sp. PBH53]|nr:hypothetical protein [Streptomyces sp. PBH53]